MSSGPTTIVINPSERALSADINRLQQLFAQFFCEFQRSFVDTSMGCDDLDASGVETPNATQLTPDSATIWNGLRVVPAIGNLTLTVTPGVISMLDPDATPDPSDSPYKNIIDGGVPLAGTIAMTGNISGSTRIDVIECSRVVAPGYSVFETDSRDIFNNVTGLFTPQIVNKIVAGALVYRVRQGTPGAGFPGAALGWVPLAVVSVPNGATTNDTMTFWDVRPLAEDRVYAPFAASSNYPHWHHANWMVFSGGGPVPSGSYLTGYVDVSGSDASNSTSTGTIFNPGRRRLGGRLRTSGTAADFPTGLPGTQYDCLQINNSANWDGTFTTGIGYLYFLESPFGLPRWARYTNAASGARKPRSPRGFLVVSATPPVHFYGTPSASVGLPTATGLGASTNTKGICFGVVKFTAGVAAETICDGRTQYLSAVYPVVNPVQTAPASTTLVNTFTVLELTNYPPGAKAIYVDVVVPYTAVVGQVQAVVTMTDFNNNQMALIGTYETFNSTSGSNNSWGARIKVPVPFNADTGSNAWPGFQVVVSLSNLTGGTLGAAGTPTLQAQAWDLY